MMILMDEALRIIDASPPAMAMLERERALRRSFGRLGACRGSDAARLGQAACTAVEAGVARLVVGQDRDALAIDLARLRQADGALTLVAILTVVAAAPTRSVLRAARRFGLPQAADRLGVARSTARTHLQRLFDKTGARRQAELVRTVALYSATAVTA